MLINPVLRIPQFFRELNTQFSGFYKFMMAGGNDYYPELTLCDILPSELRIIIRPAFSLWPAKESNSAEVLTRLITSESLVMILP